MIPQPTFPVGRIVVAVCVAILVFLGCLLLGAVLGDIHIEIATTVGNWLRDFAAAFGIVVGILYFFARS